MVVELIILIYRLVRLGNSYVKGRKVKCNAIAQGQEYLLYVLLAYLHELLRTNFRVTPTWFTCYAV